MMCSKTGDVVTSVTPMFKFFIYKAAAGKKGYIARVVTDMLSLAPMFLNQIPPAALSGSLLHRIHLL